MNIGHPLSSAEMSSLSRIASLTRSRLANIAASASIYLKRFRLRDTSRAPKSSISSSARNRRGGDAERGHSLISGKAGLFGSGEAPTIGRDGSTNGAISARQTAPLLPVLSIMAA
jgi:hypothetical protein